MNSKDWIVLVFLPLITIVVSGVVSWVTAYFTANKETSRLKLQWQREDLVSSKEEFSDMASSVSVYAITRSLGKEQEALKRVVAIRAKENDLELTLLLDALYDSLYHLRSSDIINQALTDVINYRRVKHHKASNQATKEQNQ